MRNNLETRLKPSGLPSGLPQAIEDAIILTGKMQETFLWVDALCIVQDDTDSKHSSIQSMDKIYSKALVTIVCLHGTDANAGLPVVRPASRKPRNIETRYSRKALRTRSRLDTRVWWLREEWQAEAWMAHCLPNRVNGIGKLAKCDGLPCLCTTKWLWRSCRYSRKRNSFIKASFRRNPCYGLSSTSS